ncbi:hypothetical protein V4331_10025 [Lactococcus formosensis subsp. formosensis]|uniref:hypothetical protein n=1 Tax=Lactobacillales TaxID=186826 RepID=UPI00102582F1|nr:hypothetical protein [Enterococcus faecalis]VFA80722.1 Uncharacterised protein [Enterococcus faecalis]HEC4826582.1 hypothetical protein [Enterococcus faecalis]
MSRQYMNIRLSYEAKLCIEKIQSKVQDKINNEISTNELDKIEDIIKKYLKDIDPILTSVSITNILKVSTSSIIEEACYFTWDYTTNDWLKIDEKMRKYNFKMDVDVGSLTPKLYLEGEVIERLQQYQKDFMKDSMVRVVKMSYVIKVVVFAYYWHLFHN